MGDPSASSAYWPAGISSAASQTRMVTRARVVTAEGKAKAFFCGVASSGSPGKWFPCGSALRASVPEALAGSSAIVTPPLGRVLPVLSRVGPFWAAVPFVSRGGMRPSRPADVPRIA